MTEEEIKQKKKAVRGWLEDFKSESEKASLEWQEKNAVLFKEKYRRCARTYDYLENFKNAEWLCFYGAHPEMCKERRTCKNFIPLERNPTLFEEKEK